ncbi:MAG: glycosyltransferase 61 family protein [Paracoccaceae bacterium]
MPNSDVFEIAVIADGYALADAGRYADAIQVFEKGNVAPASGSPANTVLGKCYYLTGQYQKALDHLDQAISERGADVEPRLLKVSLLRDVGRNTEALRQALALRDLQGGDHFEVLKLIVDLLARVEEETHTQAAAASVRDMKPFSRLKARLKQMRLEGRARRIIMSKTAPPELQILYLQKRGDAKLAKRKLEAAGDELERRGALSKIMSVEAYAGQSGDSFLFRGDPDRIYFSNVGDWRENEDLGGTWIEGNPAYLAALHDVTVSARSNFVFGRKGELISDSYAHPLYGSFVDRCGEASLLLEIEQAVLLHRKPVTRSVDRAIHLCGFASGHYGHWFSEYLPKLRHFEKLADFSCIPILVNDDMPPTHFEFLSAVCDNPLIRLLPDDEVKVRQLLVAPTITFYPFALLPGHKVPEIAQASWSAPAFSYLRDRVFARLNLPERERRAIYLSRKNSTWAKVINESALERALIAIGVEPVRLEEMSFIEQVACIRNADLIVSHTGSALNSVVFASAETPVIVFTHAPTHNWGGWLGPLNELGFDPKFHLVPIEETDKKHVNMEFDVADIIASVQAIREK